MKFHDLTEEVVDLAQRRDERQRDADATSAKKAAAAIYKMKHEITVAINTSIDQLVASGMDEDRAMLVVMTYLGDLVMSHDLED